MIYNIPHNLSSMHSWVHIKYALQSVFELEKM